MIPPSSGWPFALIVAFNRSTWPFTVARLPEASERSFSLPQATVSSASASRLERMDHPHAGEQPGPPAPRVVHGDPRALRPSRQPERPAIEQLELDRQLDPDERSACAARAFAIVDAGQRQAIELLPPIQL